MFVDIEDYKSPLKVEIILTPYKRGRLAPDKKSYLPKEPITPDICWEILRATNTPRSIKDMLVCIAELPLSEQAQFKEVVLSTFTQREQPHKQPHNIVLLAKKLAMASGYEDELAEAQKLHDGKFLLASNRLSYGKKCREMSVNGENFEGVDKFICTTLDSVAIKTDTVLPEILDFPYSSKVILDCPNLENVKKINLCEGGVLDFSNVEALPSHLDLSKCSKVIVSTTDKDELKKIDNFKGLLAFHSFSETYDDATQLDLSSFDEVMFAYCTLAGHPNIQFKDGANLEIYASWSGMWRDFDYTKFSQLKLETCQLENGTDFKFRDGAVVIFDDVRNLPEKLDFSNCAQIGFDKCDFSSVKQLIFKNREQFEQSYVDKLLRPHWKGNLIIADENNGQSVDLNKFSLNLYLDKYSR